GTALGQVELLGLVLTVLYYALIPAAWIWRGKSSKALQDLGPVRYGIVAFLFLTMVSLPIKMVMRIFFNIKYFWVTPWFNT
ncbi:MAG: cytochrome C, partial [candidate division NC10 bacterium]|nr:cytochrome C [candidate division NC10 bacterium]